MPWAIVVDFPQYSGPAFFDERLFPERRTWLPLRPETVQQDGNSEICRAQYALMLAWALTPWKAQGMSLEKVVVKLGAAASRPGVAFTALTRARHPDGLAIDDSFPVMSSFQ